MEPRSFRTKNFRKFFSRNYDENGTRNDNLELVVVPSQPSNVTPSTSPMVSVENFQCVENLENFFESVEVSNLLKESSKVMLLKLEINDDSCKFKPTYLEELGKKYTENSIVLFLAAKDRKRFFLYWKSKQIQQFLMLKIYDECDYMHDLRLFEFVAKFLAHSLQQGFLGLHSELKIDSSSKLFHLHLLADHRNYNLLLIAAELGDIYIVHFLLDAGFSTESHDTNAQTLAYNNRHFDIVSSLLRSNLTYPQDIKIQECPEDIKDFYEISRSLNEAIMSRNSEGVMDILSQHQEMKHFYNLENESALAFALKHKLLDMYGLLISKDVSFGPHEKFSEIKEKLKESERVKLREIHYKESKFMPDNHMHVLLSNTRFAPGTTEPKQKYEIVQKAFEILNENPFIKIILMVVAASRNFRVVFDFDRDSVEHIDPTADASMKGLFYTSGRIYIAAKQLLNPNTKFEALGTLAHELCHYAMNLVYRNMARPYLDGDLEAEHKFEEISALSKENHEQEEIIWFVYECYPNNMQHAELIVRVPHLIMQYFNNQDRFEQVRGIFIKLFDMFEGKVVAEMMKALPGIEAKAEVESQKNKKKIRNLILILFVVGLLAITGITAGIFVTRSIFYKPTYKFNELSVDDQKIVMKAAIIYKNTSLEFRGLFTENSIIYEKLTSGHISQMLNGKTLDFDDPHLSYLNNLVHHNWQNMTKKLRDKFLTSNFTFQNESLKFEKLHEINSKIFIPLTSNQIVDVLSDKKLVVHKMIKNETKFYFDRKIWDENILPIYFEFKDTVGFTSPYKSSLISSERIKIFDGYYRQFVEKNIPTQLNEIKRIRNSVDYIEQTSSQFKFSHYFEETNSVLFHKSYRFGLDEVLKTANKSKLFILSAEAGTGKTATFEQFTMRIKKKFPTQWVSYIDLKDHKALYKEVKTLQDVKKMLEKIFELSSENEFERKIFGELFEAENLILLWNGFDEISPDHSADVMRILGLIRDNTKNIQFLCTRPLYSDQLRVHFLVQTYKLIPLEVEEQEKLLRQFFMSQKMEEVKITNYVKKVQKIAYSASSGEGYDTPLMLLMIAELILNDVEIYKTENLYEIYQKFVEKKVEIWKESEFAKRFLPGFMFKHRRFDMLKVYQSYAMKGDFQIYRYISYFLCLKLKLMRETIPKELTSDEISRMGILYINGPKHLKFAHKTFAEFFVAQYVIENIYNANDEPSDKEAELRIQVLHYSFKDPGIVRFIDSFLKTKNAEESKPFDPQISKQLNNKFQKFFHISLKEHGTGIFNSMFNFFRKDHKVLKKLLQIDENETAYTAIFCYAFLNDDLSKTYDLLPINYHVRQFLSDDEFNKFIHGKNQKGKILFSLYGIKSSARKKYSPIAHADYKLDENLLKIKDPFDAFEQIAKNLTKHEIKAFLKSKISMGLTQYTSDLRKYAFNEKMGEFIEKEFALFEQKEIYENFFDIFPYIYEFDQRIVNIVKYNLNKLDKYFSGDEVFEIFSNYNVLYNNVGSKHFNILWDFFINHTTQKQQEIFLRSEKSQSAFYPPLNLLLNSLFLTNFPSLLGIYESYFNGTEMQRIIFSSSTDFLPYFIIKSNSRAEFVEYLTKVFENNNKLLMEFLLRKVEPTNLNVFELLSDYYDGYNNFEELSTLLNSTLYSVG